LATRWIFTAQTKPDALYHGRFRAVRHVVAETGKAQNGEGVFVHQPARRHPCAHAEEADSALRQTHDQNQQIGTDHVSGGCE